MIGADDYITKPFSMEELTFRIEAILRRVRGKRNKESNMYKIGRFTFDTQKQILSIGDKQTKLTTKESELLGLLCAHANEILQRDFALKTIWIDDNYFNARSMDVYITKLRKHLKDDDSIEIINIHGKGYKLITFEQSAGPLNVKNKCGRVKIPDVAKHFNVEVHTLYHMMRQLKMKI